ncbi:DUF937 domain-containing protein [Cochlodiniinecator piscidefendens]|uniref:DUF937 domain-containing protein n=1 Tax=Cochlodiniinecator piscidefendens TaxID=2715756 RepID=UPI00140B29E7|nr:DUF937 domain-containing protein [Cochlodiniinecator piscidefendens]
MSLLSLLQQAQGGQGLQALAQQFSLDEGQANTLTEMLAPAIGSATRQRAEASGGLASVLGALRGEDQAAMFDDASAAAGDAGRAQGAAFLDGILGSSEATSGLAEEAANRSGIDLGTIQQFLPALAAMLQGGMQRNMPDSSIDGMMSGLTAGASQGGGLMGIVGGLLGGSSGQQSGGMDLSTLTNMLDADGDGSPLDDILGKFMG